MASSISEAARRLSVVAVALLAATGVELGAVPVARAQPAAASDATREAARRKLVDGVDAMKRGDYVAALARFEEAYGLVPSPKIHYDFGLAYVGLGRPADALAAFERFLAEAPDAPRDKREKAASMVSTLRARVADTSGRVEREAAGSGAQPVAPPEAKAGASPDAVQARAQAESAASREERMTLATTADRDPSRRRKITALSLGAAGVGLVGAGLVFGLLAQRESDSLTNDSQRATDNHPTLFDPGKESRGLAYQRLEYVGLVAGAVAVATGAVIYAISRRRITVEPVAGHSVAGASLQLMF
ncbi:MAG TPA: tetratricopeptide repeat protein [Polyangia bacterium]|nr:tetratricopeptide repeat protein [Polyangia bacterium]